MRNQLAVYDDCLVASARRVVAPYGEKRARPQPTTPFRNPSNRQTGRRGRRPLRTILCPLPCRRYRFSSLPTGKRALHEAPLHRKPMPVVSVGAIHESPDAHAATTAEVGWIITGVRFHRRGRRLGGPRCGNVHRRGRVNDNSLHISPSAVFNPVLSRAPFLFAFLLSLKIPPIHYYNNCTYFPFTAWGFFAIIFILYHAGERAPRGREEGRT